MPVILYIDGPKPWHVIPPGHVYGYIFSGKEAAEMF